MAAEAAELSKSQGIPSKALRPAAAGTWIRVIVTHRAQSHPVLTLRGYPPTQYPCLCRTRLLPISGMSLRLSGGRDLALGTGQQQTGNCTQLPLPTPRLQPIRLPAAAHSAIQGVCGCIPRHSCTPASGSCIKQGPGWQRPRHSTHDCSPGRSALEPSRGGRGVGQGHCTLGPRSLAAARAPSAHAPALLPRRQGGPLASLTWARRPPGPGPLCGRMAGRAGAQSKLNLHLGVPSGRSARRSHRSPLMASSKCGAAASAPRVRAPQPSPRALCKIVFTKVNIGRGARPGHREPPLASPARAAPGLP